MDINFSSKLDKPEILAAIFHPRAEARNPTPPSCEEVQIEVDQGITLGCRFFFSSSDACSIVYFHGNGETVSDYDQIAPYYLAEGLNLFIAGYRGYGWSGGSPSVSSLFHDSGVILEWFSRHCQSKGLSEDIFVMGRSLGSAACIDLGHRFPDLIKGIIIESGFANTLPLAARLGYNVAQSGLTEEECFNNLAKITEIKLPTLILHGAQDQLIPLTDAVKLQAECGARTKQLYVIPGADHNSVIVRGGAIYFETIKKFTSTATGRRTWGRIRKKNKKSGE